MPPLTDILRLCIIVLLTGVLSIAAITDVRARRIPNWTVVAIGVLFAMLAVVKPPVPFLSSLEAGLIVFVISAALYAFGVIGAGDSKLMTVVALFVGLAQLPLFALITSLIGGALAIVNLIMEPQRALVMFHLRGRGGRGVPYGVAIALAGMLVVSGYSGTILKLGHWAPV